MNYHYYFFWANFSACFFIYFLNDFLGPSPCFKVKGKWKVPPRKNGAPLVPPYNFTLVTPLARVCVMTAVSSALGRREEL